MLAGVMTGSAGIRRAWLLAAVPAAMLLQVACQSESDWERFNRLREEGTPAPVAPAPRPARAENRRIADLQTQVDVLRQRIGELSDRNDRLVEEIRRLKFTNTQLRKQLEVVGDAPRQRDKYRALAAALEAEVRRLRRQVRRLEALVKSPQAASRPGTTQP